MLHMPKDSSSFRNDEATSSICVCTRVFTHTHHTRDDGGSDAILPEEVIEYYPCCASPLF